MNEQSVIDYLNAKAKEVDSIIEKWMPRTLEHEHMVHTFGNPRYGYIPEIAQKMLSEPIWDFLGRGGKRWRPALFLLTAEAFGADTKKLHDLVLIPEIVHDGSMIHDDIEDGSDLRRGKPCTHLRYGMDLAINAGSFMFFWPLLPLIKNTGNFSDKQRVRAFEIYGQELINIHLGQAMDIAWHKGIANADAVTEREYLQMCALKTGTLARLSAKLAALLSGATEEQLEACGRFAEAAGIAFQIQDDILNITESGVSEGKGLGEDITEGKRTLLVIYTLSKAVEYDKKRLLEILRMHTKDQRLRDEAIAIMNKYKSIEYCQRRAREIVEEAWEHVEGVLPESEGKAKLYTFARFLVERKY